MSVQDFTLAGVVVLIVLAIVTLYFVIVVKDKQTKAANAVKLAASSLVSYPPKQSNVLLASTEVSNLEGFFSKFEEFFIKIEEFVKRVCPGVSVWKAIYAAGLSIMDIIRVAQTGDMSGLADILQQLKKVCSTSAVNAVVLPTVVVYDNLQAVPWYKVLEDFLIKIGEYLKKVCPGITIWKAIYAIGMNISDIIKIIQQGDMSALTKIFDEIKKICSTTAFIDM